MKALCMASAVYGIEMRPGKDKMFLFKEVDLLSGTCLHYLGSPKLEGLAPRMAPR